MFYNTTFPLFLTLLEKERFLYPPHGGVLSAELTAHAHMPTTRTIWRSVAAIEAVEQKI